MGGEGVRNSWNQVPSAGRRRCPTRRWASDRPPRPGSTAGGRCGRAGPVGLVDRGVPLGERVAVAARRGGRRRAGCGRGGRRRRRAGRDALPHAGALLQQGRGGEQRAEVRELATAVGADLVDAPRHHRVAEIVVCDSLDPTLPPSRRDGGGDDDDGPAVGLLLRRLRRGCRTPGFTAETVSRPSPSRRPGGPGLRCHTGALTSPPRFDADRRTASSIWFTPWRPSCPVRSCPSVHARRRPTAHPLAADHGATVRRCLPTRRAMSRVTPRRRLARATELRRCSLWSTVPAGPFPPRTCRRVPDVRGLVRRRGQRVARRTHPHAHLHHHLGRRRPWRADVELRDRTRPVEPPRPTHRDRRDLLRRGGVHRHRLSAQPASWRCLPHRSDHLQQSIGSQPLAVAPTVPFERRAGDRPCAGPVSSVPGGRSAGRTSRRARWHRCRRWSARRGTRSTG